MYQKSHGKFYMFFFELPTFDTANKLINFNSIPQAKKQAVPIKAQKMTF